MAVFQGPIRGLEPSSQMCRGMAACRRHIYWDAPVVLAPPPLASMVAFRRSHKLRCWYYDPYIDVLVAVASQYVPYVPYRSVRRYLWTRRPRRRFLALAIKVLVSERKKRTTLADFYGFKKPLCYRSATVYFWNVTVLDFHLLIS